jgi:hypothetical protein
VLTWVIGGLAVVGWALLLRQGRITGSWVQEVYESRCEAEGYKEAALENYRTCESLTYEVALLRSAVHTVGGGVDGDEPGELDIRA